MKILLCHNYYQQAGGEDQVFSDECALLREHGHEVLQYTRHNDDVESMGRLRLARKTLWNVDTYRDVRRLIQRERPNVVHCTNIFPLISPAVYDAARDLNIPVVQSLHNYRMLCPNALLMRRGRVCEDCLGKAVPWPSVVHGCYRDSRSASAVVAAMLSVHRARKTWTEKVDRYIALTEFSRRKFIEGGLRADRIAVKPNFVLCDPGAGTGQGQYAIFVGRLSAEKGIDTLLSAWARLRKPFPLKLVGDGPLREQVRQFVAREKHVEWLGSQPLSSVLSLIGEARFLVYPSKCYETFGRTMMESFSKGTPVIASRLGAMEELVTHGRTGLHFESGNPDDLVSQVIGLGTARSNYMAMRHAARQEYEHKYTAAANYRSLIEIYEQAIDRRANQHKLRPAGMTVEYATC